MNKQIVLRPKKNSFVSDAQGDEKKYIFCKKYLGKTDSFIVHYFFVDCLDRKLRNTNTTFYYRKKERKKYFCLQPGIIKNNSHPANAP